ncbi:MAG: kynureninase [Pseudomonadota bacterium]
MTDFAATRAFFDLPEGVTYLDGNSLGPLPKGVPTRLEAMLKREWGEMLITGWNAAGWMAAPTRLGDRIAPLIGAAPGTITTGDTLSLKVYQALAAALEMRPDRRIILSDQGNFPSDLYMAQGLIRTLGKGHALKTVAPDAVLEAIDEDVAVLMLTEVDYRTGRLHDMADLTARAHAAGVVTVWDLAHSAGALPVDLAGTAADFAVGCTYKYLNGGPGAPAFIYVRPDHEDTVQPALAGWLGHEAPFNFDLDYRAGRGIERLRVGTPAVLQMAALDAALDVWAIADIGDVRSRSLDLSERLLAGIESRCPYVKLNSPRHAKTRGSQVAFRHPEAYAVMQALIAEGVIGDFRAPDNLRFGITPLYIGEDEIDRAVDVLAHILDTEAWNRPEYRTRKRVT